MSVLDKFGASPNAKPAAGTAGAEIIDWLGERIAGLLAQIEDSPVWKVLNGAETSAELRCTIMREIYQEIAWYQPDVIQATISAIGQMPRSVDPKLIRSMLIHQADEFDHGEMAVRDYVALGGDETTCRTSRPSPAAFAVAGFWRQVEHRRDPFMYLGALYLFEGLTPIVTGKIKETLRRGGVPDNALEYIEFHSTEDIAHANLVNQLIARIVDQHPESASAIRHGYECFESVYPLPLWNGAFERAHVGAGGSVSLHLD